MLILLIVYGEWTSLSSCMNNCTAAGSYAFAVVQENNCWCSNYVPSPRVAVSQCDNACPGWPYENCGNIDDNLFGYLALGPAAAGTSGSSTSTVSATSAASSSTVITSQQTVISTSVSSQVVSIVLSPSSRLLSLLLLLLPSKVSLMSTTLHESNTLHHTDIIRFFHFSGSSDSIVHDSNYRKDYCYTCKSSCGHVGRH